VISEIPSIPPQNQDRKPRPSGATDQGSKKFSKWNEEEWKKHNTRVSTGKKNNMAQSHYVQGTPQRNANGMT
jgi:hypothetical protein